MTTPKQKLKITKNSFLSYDEIEILETDEGLRVSFIFEGLEVGFIDYASDLYSGFKINMLKGTIKIIQ